MVAREAVRGESRDAAPCGGRIRDVDSGTIRNYFVDRQGGAAGFDPVSAIGSQEEKPFRAVHGAASQRQSYVLRAAVEIEQRQNQLQRSAPQNASHGTTHILVLT
jgi:hypothetical protein